MGLMQQNQVGEIKPSFGDDSDQKIRRQMLIALTLLLAALALILVKDREFWFPSVPVLQSEAEPFEEASPEPKPQPEEAIATAKPAVPAHPKAKPHTVRPTAVAASPASAAAPVGNGRTVLPPLGVEVVAGDEHRAVQAGADSVKVDLQPSTG